MPEHFIAREDAEHDLLAAAAYLAENIRSADGRAEALKVVIPIYLSEGNVDLAAELANEIDEPFSRDKMLLLVAEKCADKDDDEYALQLSDAIEDDGLRAQSIERIALAKVAKGQLEKAAEYAADMAHPDVVLGAIAVRQAEAGDDDAAEAALATIDFPAAEVTALLQTAHLRIQKGEFERAAASIEQAIGAAEDIEHAEERIRSICDAGNLFIEAKRSDLAVKTFDEARAMAEQLDNAHRNAFLVSCALGFKMAGSDDLAEQTLDLVTDKTEMASALLSCAREDWRGGKKDDAVDGLDEAFEILRSQREIETRDSRSRNALLTNIAVQLAAFGKTEPAIEAAQFNPDPEEEMSALMQIAQVHALQGDDAKVRETLEMIGDDAQRLFALISVSDSYERSGKRETAVAMLNEAVTFSDGVGQHASRSSALNELAQRFAAYEMPDRAREISLENLDVIAEIKDESSQAAALAGLAGVYRDADLVPGEAELAQVGKMLYRVN